MNKIKIIEGILISFIVLLIAYTVNETIVIQKNISNNDIGAHEKKPEYHFVVISDDVESYSWTTYISSVNDEAKDKSIVIEIYAINDLNDKSEIEKTFEIAILSKVDGIMMKLTDNDIVRDEILKCNDMGIKVITIGNDSPESNRDAYIGTNKYNLGKISASLLTSQGQQKQDVLLILGSEYKENSGASSNNYLNGIHEEIVQNDLINKLYVEYASQKRADLIVNDSLYKDHIDAIICTDPIDSLRAVKVLIDLNLVGDVDLIASSNLPEIIEYIKKGTIQSSVVEDYEIMGETSVEVLYQLLNDKRQSAYINIPISVINKESLGLVD